MYILTAPCRGLSKYRVVDVIELSTPKWLELKNAIAPYRVSILSTREPRAHVALYGQQILHHSEWHSRALVLLKRATISKTIFFEGRLRNARIILAGFSILAQRTRKVNPICRFWHRIGTKNNSHRDQSTMDAARAHWHELVLHQNWTESTSKNVLEPGKVGLSHDVRAIYQ